MKLVLLPGLDGTGVLFKPFIAALPDEIETLVISYPLNTRLSYKQLTALVISQLPEEKFILVGESFSGYIAYRVALSKPKNLESVFFIATFLENPRPSLLNLLNRLPGSLILSLPIPNFIINKYLLGRAANKKLTDLFKQAIKQVSAPVLCNRLQQIAKLPKSNQFCEIKATYIQATEDKLVPGKCVQNFKKLFNNLTVLQIESSHLVLQTNPLACVEVLVNSY